ncbi:ABC-three component system protein [Clostridium sp. ZS1]|uniref:ABC-three component system protein n=1 Tax=Clostridium sp. ZS1 TaxID=2949989 RepID=UPI00207AF059|nr:ABC-three component system protein [Clostridium sp. ZS1]
MEGALFVRKLKIESVDEEVINYSKNLFVYSDSYVRKLKKYDVPVKLIDEVFSCCYLKYLDSRMNIYRKEKDSEKFLENVVEDISKINFKELNKYMEPKVVQKSGLIHILADDETRDIRWGDNKV